MHQDELEKSMGDAIGSRNPTLLEGHPHVAIEQAKRQVQASKESAAFLFGAGSASSAGGSGFGQDSDSDDDNAALSGSSARAMQQRLGSGSSGGSFGHEGPFGQSFEYSTINSDEKDKGIGLHQCK